jgi:hypothetical protein
MMVYDLRSVKKNHYQSWGFLLLGVILSCLPSLSFPIEKNPKTFIYQGNLVVLATATPSSVCQGSPTQLEATVTGGTPPYAYSWTPVAGLNDPSIYNPVGTPLTTTWYRVVVTDSNSETAEDSVLVTVLSAPPIPGPILGPSGLCEYDTADYSISNVTGATSYSWTVPAGASILSGQNTPFVKVSWDTTPGNISVIAGNQCGNSNPSVLNVELFTFPPFPGMIEGPSVMCPNATGNFWVENPGNVETYEWTVPPDATIISGQGTHCVSILWGTHEGIISVTAQNPCGNSQVRIKSIGIDSIPMPAGKIWGNDTVCRNHSGYPYSIPVIPNADSYEWILPPGATISDGAGTNQIIIDFSPNAQSGELAVYGVNNCGPGTKQIKNILVNDCSSINDPSESLILSISPNPSDGRFTVTVHISDPAITLKVFNMTGTEVLRRNIQNVNGKIFLIIDLTSYPVGVYLLEVQGEKKIAKQKIVIR